MEDVRAAWAFVAIVLAVKVLVGALLFLLVPVGETLSLYVVVHLAAVGGVGLLLLLGGGTLLFWWRVLRLRARRRALLWSEWHVKEDRA